MDQASSATLETPHRWTGVVPLPEEDPGVPDTRSPARLLLWVGRQQIPTLVLGVLYGVVWMVDYVRAHDEAPAPLRDELERAAMNVFTAESLGNVAAGLRELEELGGEFALFLEPPSLDERIVNQYALFSLMSRPDARLDAWLKARPRLVRRVVVPAGLKWEVRDKLDQANVTERVLFPGLDGLSRWLKRYYLPRREPA